MLEYIQWNSWDSKSLCDLVEKWLQEREGRGHLTQSALLPTVSPWICFLVSLICGEHLCSSHPSTLDQRSAPYQHVTPMVLCSW